MKRSWIALILFSAVASSTVYADTLGCFIRCKDKGVSTADCEYICNGPPKEAPINN